MESFSINNGVKLTSIALLLLLISEHHRFKLGTWIFKPLASAGFLMSAIANNPAGRDVMATSPYGKSVLLGLALGAAGDVLLIPKSGFLFGLGSFFLGHLSLVYAFTLHGMDKTLGTTALAMTAVTVDVVRRWLLPKINDPIMRRAVLVYMVVISAMVVTASASVPYATLPRHRWFGALIFYLSDLFVAREEFVGRSRWNQWIGLPLYYGGQILLAGTLRH
ncbi:YhhN-like protein [Chlamydoabsidia padenii]|nr:YhhN-like protein [Chlamydoabsidia padenii]